jgi:glyoxylase-like metal-dependent hydrolase (beta-lactamase superfamily II)
MGFVWPEEGSTPHIDAALATLGVIEALAPAVVIPGHGVPFADVGRALAIAASRLEAFRADPVKNARHVLKALFVFALLDKGRMAVADVPAYLDGIAFYAEFNARFLRLPQGSLAEWLVQDLTRVGAVTLEGGFLRATATP